MPGQADDRGLRVLKREPRIGDVVAVIGGGLTGSEIAYELALRGKKPVIVREMR